MITIQRVSGLRLSGVVAVGLIVTACGVRGQQPPSPDQIVATIQQIGSILPVVSHLSLDTCPNGGGDSVFIEVSSAELPAGALAELAALWRPLLDRCGSTALQDWYDRALASVLEGDEPSGRDHFLEFLPPNLSAESRAALWRAAEREAIGGPLRGRLASRAVRSEDPSRRIEMTVDAFLRREMSSDWVYQESGALIRADAERYLAVLAARSASFDDARLAVVLGSINSNVRHGAIDVESTGLGALRSAIAGRSGVPAELRSLGGSRPNVPAGVS